MKEKQEAAVTDDKSETGNTRRMTNSTTEADSDGVSSHRLSRYEKEEAVDAERHPRSDDEIEHPVDDDADIDHDEVEATVPGHDLDVELGRVCLRPPLLSTSPSSESIPAAGLCSSFPPWSMNHEPSHFLGLYLGCAGSS